MLVIGSALLIRTSLALGAVATGLRCDEHPHDEHVVHRTTLSERVDDRCRHRRWYIAAAKHSGSRAGDVGLLSSARRRIRTPVQGRRSSAREGPVPRWRRLGAGVAGVLRGVQDSRPSRTHVQGDRQRGHAGRRDHQRSDGQAVLQRSGSDRPAARDRPRRGSRVRHGPGSADHRRRGQQQGRRVESGSRRRRCSCRRPSSPTP